MSEKQKVLRISRKRWARGQRTETWLYSSADKTMCCLGFAARQLCGAKIGDIKNRGTPGAVQKVFADDLPWLISDVECWRGGDSEESDALVELNDSTDLTDRERERGIRKVFAEHGVKVVFVP